MSAHGSGTETISIPPAAGTMSPGTIALVNSAALADLISMAEAIEFIDGAMRDLSAGDIEAPQRWQMPIHAGARLAIMPGNAALSGFFGVKLLSLYDNADDNGLPGHQGVMLLFDRETGRIVAIIEASALTRLRTAAASAVATRALARTDATSLAILGYGEQARWHAKAIPLVRPITQVRLWGRSPEKAREFVRQHLSHFDDVVIAGSAKEAVRSADIICTTTHASTPILAVDWLEPGQHLNLVGASTRNEQEVGGEIVALSRFFVDCREHALAQASELRQALDRKWAGLKDVRGEIGELLDGKVEGRTNPTQITVYKSLGHVAQDIAVAAAIHERLDRSALVARVPF
ncbi:ornithine cyclodeaminase family protein [Sphingopyxis sp. JAI128]|uniref:ornithine cyclodeaminase family protein n=1 Tax=Sphingopyxis sp. JAI128 TaxID=2723066 RepID=UPI00160C6E88|nr:ornithine cyclodeaminase family protein [Sphingopyxis sp. JAI128]MBB6427908.1 ornithine cyclodeaminase/alanine dehydrogenase-like protein (mu-crystallin family) [Sphingopyxis sp. JAI128]